jgi:hypothetical protein
MDSEIVYKSIEDNIEMKTRCTTIVAMNQFIFLMYYSRNVIKYYSPHPK